MVTEVTPVHKRIRKLRIGYSLGVSSVVSVYNPAETSDNEDKDSFYSQLKSVLHQCPRGDTLLVLRDSSTSTDADRYGYKRHALIPWVRNQETEWH